MAHQILFIDDNLGIRDYWQQAQSLNDSTVMFAASIEEANKLLHQHNFNVLVFGSRCGDMNWQHICQLAHIAAPQAYRLLLADQLDFQAVHQARQQGDLHKLLISPCDSSTLHCALTEGAHHARLLRRAIGLKTSLRAEMPTLLTDRNWIIRLTNSAARQLLGQSEDKLVGRNLFSPAISNMPVTLEAELTRQVDADQSWLGYCNLLNNEGTPLPMWAAITAISEDYCVCVFEEAAPQQTAVNQAEQYAIDQPFQALKQQLQQHPEINCVLIISFDMTAQQSQEAARFCQQALVESVGSRQPIFRPRDNIFLMPVRAASNDDCASQQRAAIHQRFSSALVFNDKTLTLTPDIRCQTLAAGQSIDANIENLQQRLQELTNTDSRQRSCAISVPSRSHNTDTDFSDYRALPVFDKVGAMIGLELLPEYMQDPEVCHLWLENMNGIWQQQFNSPPVFILRLDNLENPGWFALVNCLQNWQAGATQQPQWRVIVPWRSRNGMPHQDLLPELPNGTRLELLLELDVNIHLNSSAVKQLLKHNCSGFSLAANVIGNWRYSASMGAILLQQMDEYGKTLYAHDIDSTESLATAHQCGCHWLEGTALSRPIGAHQLHWFAINE